MSGRVVPEAEVRERLELVHGPEFNDAGSGVDEVLGNPPKWTLTLRSVGLVFRDGEYREVSGG